MCIEFCIEFIQNIKIGMENTRRMRSLSYARLDKKKKKNYSFSRKIEWIMCIMLGFDSICFLYTQYHVTIYFNYIPKKTVLHSTLGSKVFGRKLWIYFMKCVFVHIYHFEIEVINERSWTILSWFLFINVCVKQHVHS